MSEVAMPAIDGADETWQSGGCLCGLVRYRIVGEPLYAGYCCCRSCRKASASGFVPFIGVRSVQLALEGETKAFLSVSYNGNPARRNFCPNCGSLIHGGDIGLDESLTVYAGTLDDPAWFLPKIAIFTKDLAPWVLLPEGLRRFEAMPTP